MDQNRNVTDQQKGLIAFGFSKMYNVEVAPCVSISYNTVKRVFIDRKEIQSLSNHPENCCRRIILTDRDRQMTATPNDVKFIQNELSINAHQDCRATHSNL